MPTHEHGFLDISARIKKNSSVNQSPRIQIRRPCNAARNSSRLGSQECV